FDLQELHRFENTPVAEQGHLHWDVLRLWHEIEIGLGKYCAQHAERLILPQAGAQSRHRSPWRSSSRTLHATGTGRMGVLWCW
ncbi:MAG TPA: hypothetical protein VEY08_10000, partial [Chloroflexia bacterium]|nr:hypothetical protein [Chloroflexia bacterium]